MLHYQEKANQSQKGGRGGEKRERGRQNEGGGGERGEGKEEACNHISDRFIFTFGPTSLQILFQKFQYGLNEAVVSGSLNPPQNASCGKGRRKKFVCWVLGLSLDARAETTPPIVWGPCLAGLV